MGDTARDRVRRKRGEGGMETHRGRAAGKT